MKKNVDLDVARKYIYFFYFLNNFFIKVDFKGSNDALCYTYKIRKGTRSV